MPFAFLIAGAVLIISGAQGTAGDMFTLLEGEFTGSDGQKAFIPWFLAILIIGAIGYIPDLKPISTGFLALVILTLILKNGGFFDKFNQAFGITGAAV